MLALHIGVNLFPNLVESSLLPPLQFSPLPFSFSIFPPWNPARDPGRASLYSHPDNRSWMLRAQTYVGFYTIWLEGFTGLIEEFSKEGWARSLDQKSPTEVQGQSLVENLGLRIQIKMWNQCIIFWRFAVKKFLDLMSIGAELGKCFCADTEFKKFRRFSGGGVWAIPPH